MTPQQQTGALVHFQVSGQEYQQRTLTEKDHIELSSFIQQMIIGIAQQSATNLLPTDRAELLKAGIQSAFGVDWDSEEGWKIWDKPIGCARLAWQACNKPGKYDEFATRFIDKEHVNQNIVNFLTVFGQLNYEQKEEVQPDGTLKS